MSDRLNGKLYTPDVCKLANFSIYYHDDLFCFLQIKLNTVVGWLANQVKTTGMVCASSLHPQPTPTVDSLILKFLIDTAHKSSIIINHWGAFPKIEQKWTLITCNDQVEPRGVLTFATNGRVTEASDIEINCTHVSYVPTRAWLTHKTNKTLAEWKS